MILIIDACEESLHALEFVKPVEDRYYDEPVYPAYDVLAEEYNPVELESFLTQDRDRIRPVIKFHSERSG